MSGTSWDGVASIEVKSTGQGRKRQQRTRKVCLATHSVTIEVMDWLYMGISTISALRATVYSHVGCFVSNYGSERCCRPSVSIR